MGEIPPPVEPLQGANPATGALSFQALLRAQGAGGVGFGGGGGVGGGGGAGGGSSFSSAPPGPDFGGYDTSPNNLMTRQDVTGVPEAVRRILAAERQLGVPGLSDAVGSDYRTHDEQVALYQQHLAGTHPAPVAPPGQSYHEQGEAFDIDSAWLDAHPPVRPWLEHHGFVFDVPGEPWHAHFVGGGAPIRAALQAFSRPGEPSPVRPLDQPSAPTRPRRTGTGASSPTRRPNAGLMNRRRLS